MVSYCLDWIKTAIVVLRGKTEKKKQTKLPIADRLKLDVTLDAAEISFVSAQSPAPPPLYTGLFCVATANAAVVSAASICMSAGMLLLSSLLRCGNSRVRLLRLSDEEASVVRLLLPEYVMVYTVCGYDYDVIAY